MHNTGVNMEGATLLMLNVFYSEKHSTGVVRFTVILSLRWTPREKEVTECFSVASGSAAWPAACPSGSRTRRSPAGWGCHKLRLWQPPTTQNTQNVNEEATTASQAFFYLSVMTTQTLDRQFFKSSNMLSEGFILYVQLLRWNKRYLLWVCKQQEVAEEIFRSLHLSKNIKTPRCKNNPLWAKSAEYKVWVKGSLHRFLFSLPKCHCSDFSITSSPMMLGWFHVGSTESLHYKPKLLSLEEGGSAHPTSIFNKQFLWAS